MPANDRPTWFRWRVRPPPAVVGYRGSAGTPTSDSPPASGRTSPLVSQSARRLVAPRTAQAGERRRFCADGSFGARARGAALRDLKLAAHRALQPGQRGIVLEAFRRFRGLRARQVELALQQFQLGSQPQLEVGG